ncbi:hypothetical protein M4951_12570 [Blastopirellula sp. J2-11]|uniref:hypothetical protein n=1 Tax=Blastopirellula sp. J2-11 TaxID=2943192 RepID=UPI0021C98356|nr:hypothetical protein [Blastopirellula sp. J2-11]UUO09117.1 hypothetical protein M4951_12570 [Blastopirellula sp. J2-11]
MILTSTATAWGQNWGIVPFPQKGKTVKHGLTMTVETNWVENSGYRPIWVTVNTSNGMPTKADRVLTVELSGADQWYWRNRQTISAVVELPQGATTVTTEVPAPSTALWYQMDVTTYEDGTQLKDLSTGSAGPVAITDGLYSASESFPATVVIDSDAPNRMQRASWYNEQVKRILDKKGKSPIPDLRVLINETGTSARGSVSALVGGGQTGLEVINTLWSMGRMDVLNPSEMPKQWINLTSVDLAFVSLSDLRGMKANQSEQFAALTEWIRCGGNLLVTDLGTEEKSFSTDRSELAKLLGMPPTSENDDWLDQSPFARRAGVDQLRTRGYYGNNYVGSYVGDDGTFRAGTNPKGPLPPIEIKMRAWQMGLVVAIEGSPFPGDTRQWKDLLDRVGSDRWMWFQRNGLSQLRENQHYWQFMIPGVGQAPVTSFQFLISLFVIVIGPVNYFLLRSAGRLNWIIVTVPVGAAMVTMALVGFALFSDGFGVKLRTRGITLLDQRSGDAVTWSRQAYYAGLAPSSGFTFPRSAAVFEINQLPSDRGQDHVLVVSDDAQHLKRGYFRSRVTHQMLVVQPNKTELKLAITEQGDALVVENLLGVDVSMVVITGKDDKHLYTATDLKAGEKRTLTYSTPKTAGEIRSLLSGFDLQLPIGFDQYAYRASNRSRNQYYYQQIPEESISVSHATSRLERELNESVRSGFPNAPYTYEALVERSAWTPVGVPRFRSEMSVEVIRGKW